MHRHVRTVTLVSLLALLACEKEPPSEHVYTGPRVRDIDAGRSLLDASAPAVSADASATDAALPSDGMDAGALALACGPRPASELAFSKQALLESMGQCVRLHYCEFEALQRDLTAKVSAYRSEPTAERLGAAQRAFLLANASWQQAELFRVGPAAPLMDPGGQSLRDQIHAFPLFDRCRVDEQIVNQVYQQRDFDSTLINGRTLAALEYLLFYAGTDNGCSSFSAINAQGRWAALSPEVLAERKREYADVVARDLERSAARLVEAWDPSRGNFLREFSAAGTQAGAYPSQVSALNALGVSLFYLDLQLKDRKLGDLVPECEDRSCPERLEAPHARVTADNILQNLQGFRDIFQGCGVQHGGLGIDDWLRSASPDRGEELVARMLAALTEAERVIATLSPSLESSVVERPENIDAAHAAIKAAAVLLKTEVQSLLNITLPMGAVGDNDV